MTRQQKSAEERLRLKIDLLQLAEKLGNISEACRQTGCSRDSYYRYKRRFAAGGIAALATASPLDRGVLVPSDSEIEKAILNEVRSRPRLGRLMISKILHKKGISVSPSGIRLVWLRFGLETASKREAWVATQAGAVPHLEDERKRQAMPSNHELYGDPYCIGCGNPATDSLSEADLTGNGLAFPGQALTRKCED